MDLLHVSKSTRRAATSVSTQLFPRQIQLDGFVQTNEGFGPHASLVFVRGIDRRLGGVDQGQQGALEIFLTQVTGVTGKASDEPKNVR